MIAKFFSVFSKNQTNATWLLLLCGLCTAIIIRFLLFDRYCSHCVDHAWSASLAFDYFTQGIENDRAFNSPGGTMLFFGKTHAYIYGTLANLFGWSSEALRLYSSLFILLGGLVWGQIVWKITADKLLACTVIVFILLFDPFISATNLSRPEALVFFIISLCVWLCLRKLYLIAAFLVGVAFETHIMGLISGVFVLSVWCIQRDYQHKKYWLLLIFGGILGMAYYLVLHADGVSSLLDLLAQNKGTGFENIFIGYFWKAKFHRHLPELFILLICLFYIYKKSLYKNSLIYFALTLLGLMILFSFFAPRSNQNYGVYIALPIVLIVAATIRHTRFFPLFLLLSICYYLPQYGYLYLSNASYSERDYISTLKKHIEPDKKYLGHQLHWFLFDDDKNNFIGIQNPPDIRKNASITLIRDSYLESINVAVPKKLLEVMEECDNETINAIKYPHKNRVIRFQQINC